MTTPVQRVVVTWLSTDLGGAERSSFELCELLKTRYSIHVVLILWHVSGPDVSAIITETSVQVVRCYSHLEYIRELCAALALDQSATVLFSNNRTYQIDLSIAGARCVKSAVIFRLPPLNEKAFRTIPSPTATQLLEAYGPELNWEILSSAHAIVGISDYVAGQIRKFAPEHPRIRRIYVAPRMGITSVKRRIVRKFLVVSRLAWSKTVDFAIDAFGHLIADCPDAQLWIAGHGPELEKLLQQVTRLKVSENIRFLGYKDDIGTIYQEADCLLHVCGHEAFGRVVVEAANCGLLRVVSQSGGAGELVTNEMTGLTFRPNDVLDCVRALKCAYNLKLDSFERICVAAQRETRANSSPDRIADAYHLLATEILSD